MALELPSHHCINSKDRKESFFHLVSTIDRMIVISILIVWSVLKFAFPHKELLYLTNSKAPDQIHIAYAGPFTQDGYPSAMAISWHTSEYVSSPMVKFGKTSGQLFIHSKAESVKYFETFHHHAVLSNLTPDTIYYYVVGDEISGFWSSEYSFTSASWNASSSIRVAMIGDMGVENSLGTMKALEEIHSNVDFIYHAGDISYADDGFLSHPFKFTYEEIWNVYMNQIQPFASKIPYMTCPGNHEAECHSPVCQISPSKMLKLSNFSAYNHRFRMPSDASDGAMNMWFSFNLGDVHFVSINTETDFPSAPRDHYTILSKNGGFGNQIEWLRRDLKKAQKYRNSGLRPWIVVIGHRPIYSVHSSDENGNPLGVALAIQKAFEDIFQEFKVDLYICGHIHAYERQMPLYRGKMYNLTTDESYFIDSQSPIYIVNGAGGNTEGFTKLPQRVPKWSVHREDSTWGYGILESFPSAREIRFSYFNNEKIMLDQVTLKKSLLKSL